MTRRGQDARGRALGRVLADEHADVSCDAGCCLGPAGKRSRGDRGRRRRLRPTQPRTEPRGDATSPNASTPSTPPQPTPPSRGGPVATLPTGFPSIPTGGYSTPWGFGLNVDSEPVSYPVPTGHPPPPTPAHLISTSMPTGPCGLRWPQ
jgi:hypothetical protein